MFSYICSCHQCIISNVNPLSPNFMKYCLNITHHMFNTGSRKLKLINVSAILATTLSLVVYLSESVKLFNRPGVDGAVLQSPPSLIN